MPKGRPPGSKNKPKEHPKPRKPYTSTKRSRCVAKEDLLDRLKREVTEQALAVLPCEQFETWLASYAAHEGNDYIRKDQHEHTYNSTHHRVVTYGCNHTETKLKISETNGDGSKDDTSLLTHANGVVDELLREAGAADVGQEYEIVGCDAILDIYYFYESSVYQVIQLGDHLHEPTNIPRQLFGVPGSTLPPLNIRPAP